MINLYSQIISTNKTTIVVYVYKDNICNCYLAIAIYCIILALL